MKRYLTPPALAALLVLGACATATPYQPAAPNAYGFAEQQIETNRFQISFSGNSLTDRQTVETYLLYRAAELTTQQGYDYFEMVQRDTDADRRLRSSGFGPGLHSNFFYDYRFYGRRGRLYGYPRGFHTYDPFYDDFEIREVVRYEATAEIIVGMGQKPDGAEFFDARDVISNLQGNIVRPKL